MLKFLQSFTKTVEQFFTNALKLLLKKIHSQPNRIQSVNEKTGKIARFSDLLNQSDLILIELNHFLLSDC